MDFIIIYNMCLYDVYIGIIYILHLGCLLYSHQCKLLQQRNNITAHVVLMQLFIITFTMCLCVCGWEMGVFYISHFDPDMLNELRIFNIYVGI